MSFDNSSDMPHHEPTLSSKPTTRLLMGSCNLLADGLSCNEFLSDAGDSRVITWYTNKYLGRGQRLANLVCELFDNGLSILATQENDHPVELRNRVKNTHPNVEVLVIEKYDTPGFSNSRKFLEKRLKTEPAEFVKPYDKYGVRDDTISIYYDITKVTVESCTLVPISEKKGVKTQVGVVKFVTNDTSVPFYVVNGHFKSGEKAEDAQKRAKESDALMEYCCAHLPKSDNVVLLFDSNSSDLYRSADDTQCRDDIYHHWEANGFTHLIRPKSGFECLKMRHGCGSQPKKFGLFMFDTIDKAAIRGGSISGKAVHMKLNSFVRYDQRLSERQIQYLHHLRSDSSLRDQLRQLVTDQKWSDTVGLSFDNATHRVDCLPDNEILAHELQMCLYPNTNAPSDHPPIVVEINMSSGPFEKINDAPAIPAIPDVSGVPSVPSVPSVPGVPSVPSVPVVPTKKAKTSYVVDDNVE
mgnify:CR=1 FL=1